MLLIIPIFLGVWWQPDALAQNPTHTQIAIIILDHFVAGKSQNEAYHAIQARPELAPHLQAFEAQFYRTYESLTVNPQLVNPGDQISQALGIPKEFGPPLVLFFDPIGQTNPNTYQSRLLIAHTRRALFLHAHQGRIAFYENNIMNLSVSEMAKQLDIEEPAIQKELWEFDISITEAWENARRQDGTPFLDYARDRYQEGIGIGQIARELGVGTQALSDIMHHKRIATRGRRWSDGEKQVLFQQYGVTPIETLETTLGRSVASIRAKARRLGLTIGSSTVSNGDVWIQGYGFVKINGVFQRTNLENYLRTHVLQTNQQLATALNCAPEVVRRWKKKLGFVTAAPGSRSPMVRDPQKAARFKRLFQNSRFLAQEALITHAVEYFSKTGELPAQRNAMVALGITWGRAMGTGQHRLGNPSKGLNPGSQAHRRVFDCLVNFWIAFEAEVDRRVLQLQTQDQVDTLTYRNLSTFSPFEIYLSREAKQDPDIAAMFDRYRLKEQEKVITIAVDQFSQTGVLPGYYKQDKLGGYWQRVMGSGTYRLGNPNQGEPHGHLVHQRVFDGLVFFWLAFENEVSRRLQGLDPENEGHRVAYQNLSSFDPLSLKWEHSVVVSSSDLREMLSRYRPKAQQQLITHAVDRFARTGQMPLPSNALKTLGMNFLKVSGKPPYNIARPQEGRLRGDLAHNRVFDDETTFWLALESEIARRRTALEMAQQTQTTAYKHLSSFNAFLIPVDRKTATSDRFGVLLSKYRTIQQQKIIARAVDTFAQSGTLSNSKNAKNTLGIRWEKVVGTGSYRPADSVSGKPNAECAHQRVFDSRADFFSAFEARSLVVLQDLVENQGKTVSDIRVRNLLHFLRQQQLSQNLSLVLSKIGKIACLE